MSADARRRSRLALPAEVAADDNLATATDALISAEKVELPAVLAKKEKPSEEANKKAAPEAEVALDSADCSPDNVNFELVTG